MMNCPHCKKEIIGNKKFCTFCGAKLLQQMYCPKCGGKLTNDKKFCECCGAPNDFFSKSDASYPVFSQRVQTPSTGQMPVKSIVTPDQTVAVNIEQEHLPEDKNINYCPKCGGVLNPDKKFCEKCGTPNIFYSKADVSYQVFPQSVSPQSLDQVATPKFDDSASNSHSKINSRASDVESSSNNLDTITDANEQYKIATNIEQVSQPEDQQVSDDSNLEELPVNEELGKSSSSGRWIVGILIIVILAGGALVLGQRLNWWNIELLSWAGVNETQDELSEEEIGVENNEVVEEVIEVNEPYTVHLTGTIGGMYPIEVILDGERKGDGFYPANGKYRYTKYGDSWIQLHGETENVDNAISYIKILEYSDGNLTGTWQVRYDMSNNTLSGYMSDSKGEAYSVSAGSGSESVFKNSLPDLKELYRSMAMAENEFSDKLDLEKLGFLKKQNTEYLPEFDYSITETVYLLEVDSDHYCKIERKPGYESVNITLTIVGYPDIMKKYKEDAEALKSSPEFEKYGVNPWMEINQNEIVWGDGF